MATLCCAAFPSGRPLPSLPDPYILLQPGSDLLTPSPSRFPALQSTPESDGIPTDGPVKRMQSIIPLHFSGTCRLRQNVQPFSSSSCRLLVIGCCERRLNAASAKRREEEGLRQVEEREEGEEGEKGGGEGGGEGHTGAVDSPVAACGRTDGQSLSRPLERQAQRSNSEVSPHPSHPQHVLPTLITTVAPRAPSPAH